MGRIREVKALLHSESFTKRLLMNRTHGTDYVFEQRLFSLELVV